MDLKYWASRAKQKGVLAPRHGTYIDWLKDIERELAIKIGVAIAERNELESDDSNHIGFCMGEYNSDVCFDCPTVIECIGLGCKERETARRRVETLGLMKDITSDAIDKEKF